MSALKLDHFSLYGDVYEALDACDQLEMLLGRLRRQGILGEVEWAQSKGDLSEVRLRLERHLDSV